MSYRNQRQQRQNEFTPLTLIDMNIIHYFRGMLDIAYQMTIPLQAFCTPERLGQIYQQIAEARIMLSSINNHQLFVMFIEVTASVIITLCAQIEREVLIHCTV